jgi:hypothetical protein
VRAQTAHQIEGLPLRALLGKGQGVVGHSLFNGRSHLGRGPEESVRGHRTRDPLMRTAEVVGLDKECDSALAIVEIREDRP